VMMPPRDEGGDDFEELAREFMERGARVITTGVRGRHDGPLVLPVLDGVDHPVLAALATIQSFYRLAASLSVARGFDPDRPPHLQKITETR
jgi:glucosamine--fructose-6-phosphate aminotransferase (isomerizing)